MNTLIISKSFMVKESISKLFRDSFNPNILNQVSSIDNIPDNELNNYDFILINLNENNIEDLKRISQIRKNEKYFKVLVMDLYKNENLFIKSIKLDLDGYISNIEDKEEFIYIVKKIISGKKFYEGELVRSIVSSKISKSNNMITSREEQVMQEVSKGFNNYKISENLSITEYTVKKHISSVLQKLHLKNRQEIILYMQSEYNKVENYI